MADALRSVTLTRTGPSTFEARNARGGVLPLSGGDADNPDFTPVEALLAAIAGCSGVDVDLLTSRLAEPESFKMTCSAEKVRDEQGNHLGPVTVQVSITFPEGEAGDAARERLPDAVAKSRDRLCTVSRTVALATPVDYTVD